MELLARHTVYRRGPREAVGLAAEDTQSLVRRDSARAYPKPQLRRVGARLARGSSR
jgi:hypothetical protein